MKTGFTSRKPFLLGISNQRKKFVAKDSDVISSHNIMKTKLV